MQCAVVVASLYIESVKYPDSSVDKKKKKKDTQDMNVMRTN